MVLVSVLRAAFRGNVLSIQKFFFLLLQLSVMSMVK